MAGDSNVQLHVYACPPEEVPALVDVLAAHGLNLDWDGPGVDRAKPEIILGATYCDREVYAGATKELATSIVAAAPGAVFDVWTDPDIEGLGSGVTYVPTLGRYDYEAAQGGTPMFTAKAVRDALAGEQLGGLPALFGDSWIAEIDRLQREMDALPRAARIVRAPRCPACSAYLPCPVTCVAYDPLCGRRECESHDRCDEAAAREDEAHAINEALSRGLITSSPTGTAP